MSRARFDESPSRPRRSGIHKSAITGETFWVSVKAVSGMTAPPANPSHAGADTKREVPAHGALNAVTGGVDRIPLTDSAVGHIGRLGIEQVLNHEIAGHVGAGHLEIARDVQ